MTAAPLRFLTRRQAEAFGHVVLLAASGRRVTCRVLARLMGLTHARTRFHVEQLYVRGYVARPGFPVEPAPWTVPRTPR